jgi:hypothetical protein
VSNGQRGIARVDALLDESLVMLAPLIRLLVSSGVTFPQFVAALKLAFLRAAHSELADSGKRVTDSALSLLSGVHRKDVRGLTADGLLPSHPADRASSLPDEVFMRWTNDPVYLDADAMPRVLPLRSSSPETPSFEQLAQSVSRDFHSRSILEELVRLGLAEVHGDVVRLRRSSYVPRKDLTEALKFMSASISDHIAAATRNVRAIDGHEVPQFLEQSIYADELSPESIRELDTLARRIWESALRRLYALASERTEIDRRNNMIEQTMRMRFGAFFYAEPASPLESPDVPVDRSKDDV